MSDYTDLAKALRCCIAAEEKQWIPVTETNKPKAREPVMVVYVGWNDGLLHRDCTAYWSEDEDIWRWAATDDKVKVPITHYMPLPSLPAIAPGATEGGNMMDEVVVFIEQKSMGELILNNLFSEETDKYYNNCAFTSDRMAFMQGMLYASLLCYAKLKHYPATIRPEPPKEEA